MLKTHLQQSSISKFSGEGPPDPPLQGEGRERIGRGGTGREGGEECGVVGRGGTLDMGSAPLETSSGSAPDRQTDRQTDGYSVR